MQAYVVPTRLIAIKFVNGAQNFSLLIPSDYVKEIPPRHNSTHPIEVQISLFINDLNSINVKDMDFRVDMMLRQTWIDSRLNPDAVIEAGKNFTVLSSNVLSMLWQPDPIISNAKSVSVAEMLTKFGNLVLFRDKRITYTLKLAVLLSCQMDFRQFPYDAQSCPLYIESFGSNKNELALTWEKFDCPNTTKIAVEDDDEMNCNPVGIISQLKLLQFELNDDIPFGSTEIIKFYGRGLANFTRLYLTFEFERVLTQYVVQTFVPSIFIICLAWFSFFMGMDSVPGRVTLLVTSQLTLVTMFASSLSAAIPPVSYLKAMDYWMLVCLFFIFLAQIEFVVAKILDVMYRYEKTGTYYGQAGTMSKPNSASDDDDYSNGRSMKQVPDAENPVSRGKEDKPHDHQARHHQVDKRHKKHAFTKFGMDEETAESSKTNNKPTKRAQSKGMFSRFLMTFATTPLDRRAFVSRKPEDARTIDSTDLKSVTSRGTTSYESQRRESDGTKLRSRNTNDMDNNLDDAGSDDDDGISLKLAWVDEDGDERILWLEMDVAFRIIFPILFIIFNLIFWPLFLKRKF